MAVADRFHIQDGGLQDNAVQINILNAEPVGNGRGPGRSVGFSEENLGEFHRLLISR